MRARLCSQNRNKLRELAALLPGWELELLDADGYPEETADSYYENARAKALYGRSLGPQHAWMLGEDSGLEVDSLGGAPGIRSARYAPEGGEAVAKLLGELRGVEGNGRRARYVCELVLIAPDGREVRGTGTLEGRIADEARGSRGSATTQSSSPRATSEPSPSSETTGSRATPTGPARRKTC